MRCTRGRVLLGPSGTATELHPELGRAERIEQQATIACWWLDCPGQSPLWRHYVLAVVHLRPIEGQEHDPVVTVPHATHELMVVALDPDRNPDPEDTDTWGFLRPTNVVEQVQLPDDQAAAQLAHDAAYGVVHGVLWAEPPLSGQVEPWRTSLVKTAAHLRGEEHAP